MRIVMFYHSVISDWNHGNAHMLRGVAREFQALGHEVRIYEPRDAWSLVQLRAERGEEPIRRFHALFPQLESRRYDPATLNLDRALAGAGLVLVHEWNDPGLVRRIGEHRARVGGYRLFFHDTHHRAATAPEAMAGYDLRHYDGVLAFGAVLRDLYLERGWTARAWTWHEAADTRLFRPVPARERAGDLVWVGNWGDEERTTERREFLIEPVAALGIEARVYGVRYPEEGRRALAAAGLDYAGWLPNYEVPAVFGRYRATVHIPRRPYVELLPGIPTIRVFEALACGIPLVTAPWDDLEGLFTPGADFLVAHNGREMRDQLRVLLADEELGRELAAHGLRTVLARHTCAHRVRELLVIYQELELEGKERVLAS
jgi:spore maturation protein CgeB